MKAELTNWFSVEHNPPMEGYYELRRFTSDGGPIYDQRMVFWNGSRFKAPDRIEDEEFFWVESWTGDCWRGLATKP